MFETAISDTGEASWRRLPEVSKSQVMEALKGPLEKKKLQVLDKADATFQWRQAVSGSSSGKPTTSERY